MKRNIWAQKVVHSEWETGSKGSPESPAAAGKSYTAVSSELADLGYRKFNATCHSLLPNPQIPDLLRTGTLMNSILQIQQRSTIYTQCFCPLDREPVAPHMGTDGTV